jgi:hypothetical protein
LRASSCIEECLALLNTPAEIRITKGGCDYQIDRPPKKPLQRLFEAEEGGCVVAGLERLELHQEVEIAVLGVEGATQSRTKKFEPQDMKFAAELRQFRIARGNDA